VYILTLITELIFLMILGRYGYLISLFSDFLLELHNLLSECEVFASVLTRAVKYFSLEVNDELG
jgi:hypothetical protein